MPIYEYQCENCGEITEALQKFSDAPLTDCSHCQGKLRKLISQSSFHLKGTGWYVTDYKSKGTSTTNSTSTNSGKKMSTDGAGADKAEKKESKPESKD